MAGLDMTDALSGPEFLDQASYVRTTVAIDATGVGTATVSPPIQFLAGMIPMSQRLDRQSDGSMLRGSISLFTLTQLTAGGKLSEVLAHQADILTWHGRQYVVSAVEDYSAFGPGFWKIDANLLPLNPVVNS